MARLPFRGNFALSLASRVVGPRVIENGPKWAEKCFYLIAGHVGCKNLHETGPHARPGAAGYQSA